MENVDVLRPEGDHIYIRDIFGEQLRLRACIKEMNLVEHRIILEENATSESAP
jgi:predicted RNA-binding protein